MTFTTCGVGWTSGSRTGKSGTDGGGSSISIGREGPGGMMMGRSPSGTGMGGLGCGIGMFSGICLTQIFIEEFIFHFMNM